jgi:hypothetical protein
MLKAKIELSRRVARRGIGIGIYLCLSLYFRNFLVLRFLYIIELAAGIGSLALLLFVALLLFAYILENLVKHPSIAVFLPAARQEKPADKLY